jgi:hypothetical protein
MYQKFDGLSEKIRLKDVPISCMFYKHCLIALNFILWHSFCKKLISDGAAAMQSVA